MIRIRRVLCPIDFSECSERALVHAVALCRWLGAELSVLHTDVLPYFAGTDPSYLPLVQARSEDLREKLAAFVRERVGDMRWTPMLGEGDPAEEIVGRARSGEFELVVMGTHG